ncbi:hypothetical protein AB0D67_32545 [Streptosporangium sp. NPDC048047]|uniref:hypothetical protein n=1 Tax=Streptosporangium sp. NPDC048047 TaxID=3155748 RepID=UPI00343A4138
MPTDASTKPEQRYFVAVTLLVTALCKADQLAPPISGSLGQVKGDGKTFGTSSGNAVIALWGGRVDSGVSALRKNDPAVVIKTFDLPRMGDTSE